MKKILAAFSALFKPAATPKSHSDFTDPLPPKPPYDPEISVSSFGYKMAWVAIRSDDELAIVDAIGLLEARWLPWDSAVEKAYRGEVVGVTPVMDGWVLVFGREIFGWQSDDDYGPVNELAKRFEEVQYFATHRVSEGHIWARWLNGQRVRLMEHIDEMREEGQRTAVEGDILVPKYPDEDPEWISVEESDVMMVAGKWSINPDLLEERELKESHILVGKLLK